MTYPLDVTEAQIKEWKKKYKEVHLVTVPATEDDQEELYGYFRKPDLKVIGAAGQVGAKDPIKGGEILFNSCLLKSSPELKENDEAKLGAIKQLNTLFKPRAASVKKL
ncbi:MAG: hypothetical protein EP346_06995 [Bacteroidetes bacterium]|nr:MAG: hypothetical protein EP346_06995 [Bacteroidota bacterium]